MLEGIKELIKIISEEQETNITNQNFKKPKSPPRNEKHINCNLKQMNLNIDENRISEVKDKPEKCFPNAL